MKNKFYKKVFWGLILIMVLGILSAGCVGGGGGTTPPLPPTTYTVNVVSQHPWCYGTVYVSGAPTNAILVAWGSATVYNVVSGAAIYLVDTAGLISHTEYFNPILGTTVVFSYWW